MPSISRRRFLQATGAATAGIAAAPVIDVIGESTAHASGGRPNIVMICTDDQRADETSQMPKTAARLFNQATQFTGFVVGTPVCEPSRASFITGQYVQNHHVGTNASPQGPVVLHSPDQLSKWVQDAGYYTACLGKFLNCLTIYDPVPPGWSDFQGHCGGGGHRAGTTDFSKWTINNNGTIESGLGYVEDEYRRRVPLIVSKWRAVSSAPLFFYIGDHAPHHGVNSVATRYRTALSTWTPTRHASFNEADVSDKPAWVQALPLFTPTKINTLANAERIRLRQLLAVDDVVDTLLTALGADLANTVVIFTSDNGFMNGEHRIASGKSCSYEESIRVPLFIKGPGFPAGATINGACSGTDIASTICDLAGATPTRVQDGRSIVPYVANPNAAVDRAVLINDNRYHTARTTRWKYVRYARPLEEELYDLQNDPYEVNSLHNDPGSQRQKALLFSAVKAFVGAAGWRCIVYTAPVAAMSTSTSGMSVSCDASDSVDLDGPLTYAWDFGDGNTATGVQVNHQYQVRGTYTVKLTVTNTPGNKASTTASVKVDGAPTAAFTWNATGLAATFDANSSGDPDGGSIVSYAWDFGDGGSGTGIAPAHTYAATGTYTVKLTITDDGGLTGTATHDVNVASV